MPNLPLGIPSNVEKYFYNRKNGLVKIKSFLNTLNQNVANQILITGNRGVRKSFLLKKLLLELPEDILTSYIDISNLYGIQKGNLTEEQIMQALLENMNSSLRNDDDTLKKKIQNSIKDLILQIKNKEYDFKDAGSVFGVGIPDITDDYQKLSKFVMEYPQKIVDSSKGKIKGFVIVIDEFQFIGELESPEAFFWLIRSFTQKQDNVSYIFTGSTSTTSEMVNKLNGITGAFGNRMIQFNLDPFTKKETKNYLKERVNEIKFTDEGLKRFYKCTIGYPAYINSFCNMMSSSILYDENEVIHEFYQKLEQIAVKWVTIWSSLSNQEKDIISTLVENKSLKWNELIKKLDFSESTVRKNLIKLKNKGLINHHNKIYNVEDYMLSSWLKNEKDKNGFYPS
ncbi:MAG: AAA family ATPase [Methanobrevibacter sp.]|jgi:Cdc6-like AAA superfamily ATPase|nr:AAA family ATPase [Candidatus Methanovirga procula]